MPADEPLLLSLHSVVSHSRNATRVSFDAWTACSLSKHVKIDEESSERCDIGIIRSVHATTNRSFRRKRNCLHRRDACWTGRSKLTPRLLLSVPIHLPMSRIRDQIAAKRAEAQNSPARRVQNISAASSAAAARGFGSGSTEVLEDRTVSSQVKKAARSGGPATLMNTRRIADEQDGLTFPVSICTAYRPRRSRSWSVSRPPTSKGRRRRSQWMTKSGAWVTHLTTFIRPIAKLSSARTHGKTSRGSSVQSS